MVDITIKRTGGGNESVTLPLRNTANGLAVARDIGKTNTDYYDRGREDPDINDSLSGQDNFTVVGELSGSNAYSNAKTLAEDIIKRRPTSSDFIQLDLTNLPSGKVHDVAAISESACKLTYPPGVRQNVIVNLSVQVVNSVSGGSQDAQSNLSADSGSDVKLTDGSVSVTISKDLEVVRTVGRGSGKLTPATSDLPNYFDLNKPAVDVFELSAQLRGSDIESTAQTLEQDLIRTRQGKGSLELHFQGNELGLDAYPVIADGAQALRTTFSVGETDTIGVQSLSLRVVDV